MSKNHFGDLRTQSIQFIDQGRKAKKIDNSRNCTFHTYQYSIPTDTVYIDTVYLDIFKILCIIYRPDLHNL